jgi:hypothetical protein
VDDETWRCEAVGVYEAAGRVHVTRRITRLPRQIKATHGRAFQINDRAPSTFGVRASEPMAQSPSLGEFRSCYGGQQLR